jgi:hypothetical protein
VKLIYYVKDKRNDWRITLHWRNTDTHVTGDWVGSRNGLDIIKNRKNCTSCSESNLISFSQSNYNIIDKDLPYIKPPQKLYIYIYRESEREREREKESESERKRERNKEREKERERERKRERNGEGERKGRIKNIFYIFI